MCLLQKFTSITFILLWALITSFSILCRRELPLVELKSFAQIFTVRDRISSSDSESRA
jgi:hypothetical protein